MTSWLHLSWWKEQFLKSSYKNYLYHIPVWVCLFIVLLLTDNSDTTFLIKISKELINLLFYITIVYFNLYILIPSYLKERKYLLYGFALVGFVLVLTPIKTVLLYTVLQKNEQMAQSIIDNQTYLFLSNMFFAFASTVFQILTDWRDSEQELQELELQNTQTELNFLKTQMNPHFLFNTLNNLYALTLKKSDSAPQTVLMLSEIMRYMLYECNEPKVLLSKELKYLSNYIELESLRLANKNIVKFYIEGEPFEYKISPLILTPFVENAFKHGIGPNPKEESIILKIEIKYNRLMMSIVNNKAKLQAQPTNKKSGGIGLKNVKRRLEILYPKDHELKIENLENNYSVYLKLKLDK